MKYKPAPKVYLLQMGKVVSTTLFGNRILQHTKTLYGCRYSINQQFIVLFLVEKQFFNNNDIENNMFFKRKSVRSLLKHSMVLKYYLTCNMLNGIFQSPTHVFVLDVLFYIVNTNVPRKCQSFSLKRDKNENCYKKMVSQ